MVTLTKEMLEEAGLTPETRGFIEGTTFWTIPYASSSDYSGSTVELSNARVLDEDYDFVQIDHGSYGSESAGIMVEDGDYPEVDKDEWESFVEVVQGLEIYPVVDEGHMSELEHELTEEAWESWAAGDFAKALEGEIDALNDVQEDYQYEVIDIDVGTDAMREYFERLREKANEYWEAEYNSMHIDVDRVAKEFDPSDLDEILSMEGTEIEITDLRPDWKKAPPEAPGQMRFAINKGAR